MQNQILKESWKPAETEDIEYLEIKAPEDIKMKRGFFPDRLKFWRNLDTKIPYHKIREEL